LRELACIAWLTRESLFFASFSNSSLALSGREDAILPAAESSVPESKSTKTANPAPVKAQITV
jgi:hypothetical protein